MAGAQTADATAPATGTADDVRQQVTTSVVIPVHNERENLPALMEELEAVFRASEMAAWRPWEVLFVEDGSSDGTRRYVDDLAASEPHVTAIHLRRSFGQSAALAAGFDAASGEVIIPMDGDGQNDPRDIPALLAEYDGGADVVNGWRRDRQDPWHKTVPSWVQTKLAMWAGPAIHDYGCTLTVYDSEAIAELDLRGERHRYIPMQLHARGYTVDEVAVNHRPRKHGQSRYGVGRLVRGFVDLLYHSFAMRYRARPMHFFGAIGLVLFVAGMGLGTWLLIQNYFLGGALLPNLAKLILATTLTLSGVGLAMFGFLVELLMELRYRDASAYRVDEIVE